MLSFIRQRIYLQLFIALAAGASIGQAYPLPIEILLDDVLLIVGIIVILMVLWYLWRSYENVYAILPGYTLLVLLGFLSSSIALGIPVSADLNNYSGEDDTVLIGSVASMPKYQRGHHRFLLNVSEIKHARESKLTYGLCYVFLKTEEPIELSYREKVEVRASVKEIEPPPNKGQFDYRHYLITRGTVLTAYAPSKKCFRRLAGSEIIWSKINTLRDYLTQTMKNGLPEELGELAVSVVYGDKITDLNEDTMERFRRAGLTHILVASGTQISLLIILLSLLVWRVSDDFSWRGIIIKLSQFLITLAIILVYAAITGFETSILRALAMGFLVMVGRLVYRQTDGLTALAQSGIILLMINPLLLQSPGFQLSFGATFGLIYFTGTGMPFISHLSGVKSWIAQTLLSTGGAQLAVMPVLIAHFNQLSLWGLPSNLLAIPLAFALLVVGGLSSLGLGSLPVIGDFLKYLIYGLSWLLNGIAHIVADLPGSNIAVPHPPWWWISLFYVTAFLICELLRQRESINEQIKHILITASLSGSLLLISAMMYWFIVPSPGFTALVLPRSEAYIFRPYSGKTILLLRSSGINSNHNTDTVVSALKYRGINQLNGLIVLDASSSDLSEIDLDLQDYSCHPISPDEIEADDWDVSLIAPGHLALKLRHLMINLYYGSEPPNNHHKDSMNIAISSLDSFLKLNTVDQLNILEKNDRLYILLNSSKEIDLQDAFVCQTELDLR